MCNDHTHNPASHNKMTFSDKYGIIWDMLTALKISLLPTLFALLQSPSLLFSPRKVQGVLMANIWANGFGDGVNDSNRDLKTRIITPNAKGVVLDVGAGHGHTIRFLDKSKVTKYVALEPNVSMHPRIYEEAGKYGVPVEVLGCGINELSDVAQRFDSVVCVLTLCSVPDVHRAAKTLHSVLKEGGCLIVYEHVKSGVKEVQWWQRVWEPVWGLLFDQCRLTVDSVKVLNSLDWKEKKSVGLANEGEELSLFVHEVGIFVK
ncbi:hypothetical protein HDU79_008388 [Rhizoclosmatium sp. JEL0117]|nr:hypothetical protein HDU79_008388 [Rhizoclosmatium sp. JEL0117]